VNEIKQYFDTAVYLPNYEPVSLERLWNNEGSGWLICGDFWGIQKFIFEGLSNKNAAKVLRAKSAFVELFTEYVAHYICHLLNIEPVHIIAKNAGKFEILSPVKPDITSIQEKIDRYFIEQFFGLSGMSVCAVETSSPVFISEKAYLALRNDLSREIEYKKYEKFSLTHTSALLAYDTGIDNQTLCPICNIRKITTKEHCHICNSFVNLGKLLAIDSVEELVSSSDVGIESNYFDDFTCELRFDVRLKSYMQYESEDGQRIPASFETLAKSSCHGDGENGLKTLAVLKADADHMGRFIRNSDVTASFESFDLFSKGMDAFFSIHIAEVMRERYPNTYTVFGGGDDLFIVGAWDEVLALAREVHDDFACYVKGKLSLSCGITLAKPATPISFLAEYTENLLEDAKEIDDQKDALSMFGETVKWKDYTACLSSLIPVLESQERITALKTAWLYRILELAEMSKRVKYEGNIEDTIWRSKLSYSISRNVEKAAESFRKGLDEAILRYPKETKLVIMEFIYKRRKI